MFLEKKSIREQLLFDSQERIEIQQPRRLEISLELPNGEELLGLHGVEVIGLIVVLNDGTCLGTLVVLRAEDLNFLGDLHSLGEGNCPHQDGVECVPGEIGYFLDYLEF